MKLERLVAYTLYKAPQAPLLNIIFWCSSATYRL